MLCKEMEAPARRARPGSWPDCGGARKAKLLRKQVATLTSRLELQLVG